MNTARLNYIYNANERSLSLNDLLWIILAAPEVFERNGHIVTFSKLKQGTLYADGWRVSFKKSLIIILLHSQWFLSQVVFFVGRTLMQIYDKI